nr:hypothetical protein [Candidatus Freyarchaeota archaeon]
MRPPAVKQLLPVMLILRIAVQAHLSSYNNKLYSQKRPCPRCGSKNVVKRGTETKLFCKLITENGFEDTGVLFRSRTDKYYS